MQFFLVLRLTSRAEVEAANFWQGSTAATFANNALFQERVDHGQSLSVEGMFAAATEGNEQGVGDLALARGNEHRRVGDSLAANARLKVIGSMLPRDLQGSVAAFESAQADRWSSDDSDLEVN